MLKGFIEAALEAEMEAHLDPEQRKGGNKRNGRGRKTIKNSAGSFEIDTPQDRQSNFDPQLIKKRETVLADSLRDISVHISEMYDTELSQITDRIIPEVKAWQSRPLEAVYCIVWLDAARYKALYNILGINRDGYKQVLGCYVSESEGANFWLQVLSDMQNRGLNRWAASHSI